ncbi:cyclic pyranopterin monophosphate synthase subunit MoaC [Gillisia sp. Hel_I_86]|uniref:cyclic pyranopterin monophosphate synthase MoaC n=1 Tax=Gillisia sp. Hel_I_86 TaxID=1249981 RepID=UPI00119A33FE|nr:cyclic pyranopterin monophosphate synthase MoaC [Gillisia sp. Hel_I_86]TVZ27138.1 cyclic pyranopterin monophosphate synthase subunit MoaC [Gillisia sp. Hel_I_86]
MSHKLSHIDESGNAAMVDVSAKEATTRIAIASGKISFPPKVFETLKSQDFLNKKGSITQTAIIAGIQAVKQTANLIPLCHQLPLSKINIEVTPVVNALNIVCEVKCNERTGVEMEALTGVSICALTIYDMCKALSQDLKISDIQLEKKEGGKSNFTRQI